MEKDKLEFVKIINRWGGKKGSGGKCYIPNKFIGMYAHIKIIDKKELNNNKRLQSLLEISFRVKTDERGMKERKEKLQNHLNKLKKVRLRDKI